MKNAPVLLFGLLLLCITQIGCVQLKEVHAFTETSQKALESDNQIGYGYADYCFDSCYIFNVSGKQLADFDCPCSNAEIYDTLIQKEYAILSAYFAVLGKLGGAKSTINFAPVGGAIRAGTYGKLTITSTECGAMNGLATAATYLFTTKYKSKKIKEIIIRYNDTLSTAMELLKLHIDNLKSMIGLMGTKLQQRCDLLMANAPAEGEKWAIVYTYKQKSKELGQVVSTYDKRYQSLDKIKQGHTMLYENVNDLNSESVKKRVLDLSYDIIYLSNNK
jgi:hypothetical protein